MDAVVNLEHIAIHTNILTAQKNHNKFSYYIGKYETVIFVSYLFSCHFENFDLLDYLRLQNAIHQQDSKFLQH